MIESDGLYAWPESMRQDEPEKEDRSWFKYNPFADVPNDYYQVQESLEGTFIITSNSSVAKPSGIFSEYSLDNRIQREFAQRGLNDIIRKEQRVRDNMEDFASLAFIDPDFYDVIQQYFSMCKNILN